MPRCLPSLATRGVTRSALRLPCPRPSSPTPFPSVLGSPSSHRLQVRDRPPLPSGVALRGGVLHPTATPTPAPHLSPSPSAWASLAPLWLSRPRGWAWVALSASGDASRPLSASLGLSGVCLASWGHLCPSVPPLPFGGTPRHWCHSSPLVALCLPSPMGWGMGQPSPIVRAWWCVSVGASERAFGQGATPWA